MANTAIQEDLQRAVKLFNRWQFEDAHEAFTKLSQEAEGRDRVYFDAIAMLASGFWRIWSKGGEPNAMVEYLERGWETLRGFERGTMGLDLSEFEEGVPSCLEEAARWRRGDVEMFNRDFIPRIEFIG